MGYRCNLGDDVAALGAEWDRLATLHAKLWNDYLTGGSWDAAHTVHLKLVEVGLKRQAAIEEAQQVAMAADALARL